VDLSRLAGGKANLYSKAVQVKCMAIQASYTDARANLAKLCDEATDNCETVIIKRRGRKDVALVAASELSSLLETAYLLRSPTNAARLMRAFKRSQKGKLKPMTLDALRREIGIDESTE
jgi:antitoxin YefM